MRFSNLNEEGIVLSFPTNANTFSFRYVNKFYGECGFVATLVEDKFQGVVFDENSLVWQEQNLKNGTPASLEISANRFFEKILNQFGTVKEFESRISERSPSSQSQSKQTSGRPAFKSSVLGLQG